MFRRFKRLFKTPPEPKYKLMSRIRLRGWVVCECKDCDCSKLSKWEDRQCIPCWRGVHRTQHINTDNKENKH